MTVTQAENKTETPTIQEKVDTNVQPKTDAAITQQPPQEAKAQETTNEDPNWKAFREARKKDRAEREAAERRAAEKEAEVAAYKAAMEAAFAKSTPSHQAYQQHYGLQSGFGEQETTEEHLLEKKIEAALNARLQAHEKARQEQEQREYPQRLNQTFPDFSTVINQDTLDYLDYHYPEVSKPLQRLPDGYDKWADIYRAVKKFVPNHSSANKEAARAEANFNKPKSMSSPQITQPGQAKGSHILSEEKKMANWQRMQMALKGVS